MLSESKFYEKAYRSIVSDDIVKVYNEKSSITIDEAISFDSEKEEFTSIDYFVSSIVSELILTMFSEAKKRDAILQDVEAKVRVEITNPLYLLNVVGYEEKSSISKIYIDIYFFSFLEGEDLDDFLKEILARTLIYNTLADLIDVEFKVVL